MDRRRGKADRERYCGEKEGKDTNDWQLEWSEDPKERNCKDAERELKGQAAIAI